MIQSFLFYTSIIGGIVVIFELFYMPYKSRKGIIKELAKLKKKFISSEQSGNPSGRSLRFGDLELTDCILLDGLYSDYNFKFLKQNVPVNLPEELRVIANRLQAENEQRKAKNEDPIFSDLTPYCIRSISFNRLEGGGEKKVCTLEIVESSYFNSLISILKLDELLPDGQTVHNKYYKSLLEDPYNLSPNGFNLIHGFGINVLVLTSDNKVILAQRNKKNVATSGGHYSISVGEHFNQESIDETNRRDIDINKIGVRGIFEELGIEEEEIIDDLKFHSIGFLPAAAQYGALGFAKVTLDSSEIWPRILISKDGSREISNIKLVDFSLNEFVNFLKTTDVVVTQYLVASVLISLMEFHSVSMSKVESAFKGDYWRNDFLQKLKN